MYGTDEIRDSQAIAVTVLDIGPHH